MAGAIHLLMLILGAWTADLTDDQQGDGRLTLRRFYFAFDVILGCLGVVATLTAAANFPHKLVSNAAVSGYVQSGTLHKTAIVTQAEMIEHSFYQALNLLQATYLHALSYFASNARAGTISSTNSIVLPGLFLLWLVTSPWYFRSHLPVHSFSHNWKLARKQQELKQSKYPGRDATNSTSRASGTKHTIGTDDNDQLEVLLYRIKKAQYLFYKHGVLHGVNLTVILDVDALKEIPYQSSWRTFWILLNASYVMEFFMQTMVKRNVIDQSTMLWFQRFLMAAASLGAMVVLKYVPIWIFLLSLVLNFVHRHHDVVNTMGIAILGLSLMCVGN
jgi:hypothetical protein